jgi:hypothetical protein
MRQFAFVTLVFLTLTQCTEESMTFELNYDEIVWLDAEDLGEAGIGEAYQSLLPKLRQYVDEPAEIEEVSDVEAPAYSVRYRGKEYQIYSPDLEEGEGQSWGRATYAFFSIVNDQMGHSSHRFYAINGGNDLGGMFLTPAECEAAIQSLENKSDWPYIPTSEHPAYGQHY